MGGSGQYVVDIIFGSIRIGGSDSLGSVQIVISLYDENVNFSFPNKNYSRHKLGEGPSLEYFPYVEFASTGKRKSQSAEG